MRLPAAQSPKRAIHYIHACLETLRTSRQPRIIAMNGPATLSLKQRVETMIVSARDRFGCSVTINQSDRTALQAQQFHVCHMFLYNYFKNLRQRYLAVNGKTVD